MNSGHADGTEGATSRAAPAVGRGQLPPAAIVLRSIAVVIAVLGVLDPAMMRARVQRPLVALVTADSVRHHALLARATDALARDARMTRGVVDSADVMVVVGDALPAAARALGAARGGVLLSARPAGAPRVVQVTLPSLLTPQATAHIVADIARDASASRATVQLLHDGLVVASDSLSASPAASGTSTARVALLWTPPTLGVQQVTLRVFTASSARTPAETLLVDLATRVDTTRVEVLAWDARPSWLATFVRRAVARDARFLVRSRVVTSRDVARATRGAPSALSTVTPRVDVVLVGAPDALSARDAAELRRLVSTEGVALVVLPDAPTVTPLDGTLGFGGWQVAPRRVAAVVRGTEALGALIGAAPATSRPASAPVPATMWRGVSIGTPRRLPAEATVLARLDDASAAPVLWRAPIGRGEVLVSSVFDAWRTRDDAQSTFTADWPALVASLAARRLRPLSAQPSAVLGRPGEALSIDVSSTDNASKGTTDAATDAVRAHLVAPAGDSATPQEREVAVTPMAEPGRYRLHLRAPTDTGAWLLRVTHHQDTLHVPMVVGNVRRDRDDDPALLAAWVSAHHGAVVPPDDMRALTQVVREAHRASPRTRPWHPMRSPWWIVPFALALAGEWWLRRRRGWP